MALVFVTTRHLPLGPGGQLLPPGTVIADAADRDLADLIDRGWISVSDDSLAGGSIPDPTGGNAGEVAVINDDEDAYELVPLDDAHVAVTTNTPVGAVGAAETVDADVSLYHELTLDENLTLTVSNLGVGQRMTVVTEQDGTGTNTITVAALTDNNTDVLGGLDTTAGAVNVLVFMNTSHGLMVFLAGELMS